MMTQQEWDYKVSTRELQVHEPDGSLLRTHLSTVDDSSGEILGLVSRRYNLIQNKTLYDVMTDIQDDLDLTLQAVTVVKDKRATLFRYKFSDDKAKVVENSATTEDKVRFGFEVFNSFDSRLGGGGFRAWAERLVCTNGLVVPKEVGRVSFRQFGTVTSKCIKDTLIPKIEPILETTQIWNRWAQVVPSRIKVGEFVSENFRSKRAKIFLDSYDRLPDKSIWGLYNLITFHISHEAKSKVPTDIRMKQWDLEKIVAKFYKVSLN